MGDGTWVRLTRSCSDGNLISSSLLFVTAVWDVSQCLVVHFHFHLLTYDDDMIFLSRGRGRAFCNVMYSYSYTVYIVSLTLTLTLKVNLFLNGVPQGHYLGSFMSR